jgi:hypothetical protein
MPDFDFRKTLTCLWVLENLPSTLSVVEEMEAAQAVTKSEVMLENLPSTLSVVEEMVAAQFVTKSEAMLENLSSASVHFVEELDHSDVDGKGGNHVAIGAVAVVVDG